MHFNPSFIMNIWFIFLLLTFSFSNFSVSATKLTHLSSNSHNLSSISFKTKLTHRFAKNPNFTIGSFYNHVKRTSALIKNSGNIFARTRSLDSVWVMSFEIGDQRVKSHGIIDTGSDLLVLQSEPCVKCLPQHDAMYDSTKSSTFKPITCTDLLCYKLLEGYQQNNTCYSLDTPCRYNATYEDGSYSIGSLARESFWFTNDFDYGYTVNLNGLIFGAGFDNGDPTLDKDGFAIPGVIGLSRTPASIVTQLNVTQFGFCFGPINDPEHLGFLELGDYLMTNPAISPLFPGADSTFFYLSLEGISLNVVRLPISNETFVPKADGTGGMILDSGTSITYLTEPIMLMITTEIKRVMEDDFYVKGHDDWCVAADDLMFAPEFTFHFTGADLILPKSSTWMKSLDEDYCLSFVDTQDNSTMTLGAYQLQNTIVGFNLAESYVSFKKFNCAEY